MKNTLTSSRKQNQKGRTARGPATGIPRRTIGIDLGFERSTAPPMFHQINLSLLWAQPTDADLAAGNTQAAPGSVAGGVAGADDDGIQAGIEGDSARQEFVPAAVAR